eukprot:4935601-Prymnesium_polylepis.1
MGLPGGSRAAEWGGTAVLRTHRTHGCGRTVSPVARARSCERCEREDCQLAAHAQEASWPCAGSSSCTPAFLRPSICGSCTL